MCGIVGYVGHRSATDVILDGLQRLEYRGYDSAGLAVVHGHGLEIRRHPGKVGALADLVRARPLEASVGLGHTRWATHGRPSEANAHPHADCSGSLVVVHNGIIENHLSLKERLIAEGHRFRSETDTEVIAHLVERERRHGAELLEATQAALRQIRGAYAVAILDASHPDRLIAAKHGAGAVVVGLGEGEAYLASDIAAILPYTRDVIVLEDDEVVVLTRGGVDLTTLDGHAVQRAPSRVSWDAAMAEKGDYPHFMLKEIYEQPRAVVDTFHGRIDEEQGSVTLAEANLDRGQIRQLRRVVLVACGTSFHAALAGRFMLERMTGLPAEVDVASEFRYRDLALGPDTLVIAISQSGETADTLGAVKAARVTGAAVLGITNVAGSALAREATGVFPIHAGPEIGVASSKTFAATMTACYMIALALGRTRDYLSSIDGWKLIDGLLEVPGIMQRALGVLEPQIRPLAAELADSPSVLYLGRGIQHPVALEGALKLKELSYIHAEGYAGGEMKHGPIALIDPRMPVVALTPRDNSYDRMVANVEEVRAREGRVIAIAHDGDTDIARRADHVITIPPATDLLSPLVTVLPLQLLAYHVAVLRGCDVDQPRNLAKSVTVE
jgi:glucosamine--fructose-6-phosphate aminotransferase (isomerizing)